MHSDTTRATPVNDPRGRLLIVEDDPVLRAGFANALRREDLLVTPAASRAQALSELESLRFDIVVTDLELPDGSGLDLVEAVSKLESPPPVLIASSAGSEEDITRGIAAGAYDYLVKPFPISLLTSKVEHLLLERRGPLAELLPGGLELAFGRFKVLEELGRGGQGVVHRAVDLETGLPVALKLYRPARNARRRQRILREAYALARVRHPALPQIVAHGQGDLDYLALQLVEGPTLSDRVRDRGPLDPSETLALLRRLGSGLGALHAADFVHRDVKPANVILRDGDPSQAVLTDFGLAKLAFDDSLTAPGKVCGTTRYMSPEQIMGRRLSGQSDLFSLGLLASFAVSGQVHHPALEGLYLAKALVSKEIPLPDVPQPLRGVLERLVAISPEARFSRAADLLGALPREGGALSPGVRIRVTCPKRDSN